MIESLRDAYKNYFRIGAAVSHASCKTHAEIITKHFNSITCENEMKFGEIFTNDVGYDFSKADSIYQFAVENNLSMRGHTLVWHNQNPDFLLEGKSGGEVLELLKNHMSVMAERYDGNVYAWDVVNEAIDDENGAFLRETKWLKALGSDYVGKAFCTAKEFFKSKDLYYNDYGETTPEKRAKMIGLIKDLQEHDIPITGVGLQSHYNMYNPSPDEVRATLEDFAKLGLKISVTELDVSMFRHHNEEGITAPTAQMIEQQAEFYRLLFKVYREYHDYIDSVTLWGVADDCTWRDDFPVAGCKDWPLLFDENHEPKEAFWRVVDF